MRGACRKFATGDSLSPIDRGDGNVMTKLGDVCTIVSGTTPKTSVSEYWDGDINWITPAELNEDTVVINESKRKITKAGVNSCGLSPFPAGTVILSSRAPIGKTAIAGTEMYCNQGFKNLICSDKIHNKYLFWFLRSKTEMLNSLGRGATFKEISKSIVENIEIPLPDISEQRRIADTLDKVAEGIGLCRKMLGELDLMVKAKFGEMFGDAHNNSAFPYKNIGDLTTVTSGGTPDRENNLYWDDGNIRWVKTTELQNCTICDTEEKITKLGLENSSAKLVPAGSVLIAMYGQGKTRGMTAYLENESATNQACACILPSSKINQKYLWKYLMLSYDKLRSMAKGGNQPNLNIGIIKNFPVLYPPIELQNQYVEFVIYIDKSILTIKGILAKMEEMKLALMRKCFKEGKHGE